MSIRRDRSKFSKTHAAKRSSSSKSRKQGYGRKLGLESLEDRRVLALVGVAPVDLPTIGYNSGGTVSYDAVSDEFSISATPLSITTDSATGIFFSGGLDIDIQVDGAGALVGGVAGDDLVLTGDVDVDGDFVVDYSGTLLTAEIVDFGFEDSGGTTDQYDFRFEITGGQLAHMYADKDLGVTTSSENSTFLGSFLVNFGGNAKGDMGAIDREVPEQPGIDLEKLVKIMKKADHHDKCFDFFHHKCGQHHGSDEPTIIGPKDADDAPGVIAEVGDKVMYLYEVTNTGDVALNIDSLIDDNGTPNNPADDFMPAAVDADMNGFNDGDVNNNGALDPGEKWQFQTAFAKITECGKVRNVAVVKASSVNTGVQVMDQDPAVYTALPNCDIKHDRCDNHGKDKCDDKGKDKHDDKCKDKYDDRDRCDDKGKGRNDDRCDDKGKDKHDDKGKKDNKDKCEPKIAVLHSVISKIVSKLSALFR